MRKLRGRNWTAALLLAAVAACGQGVTREPRVPEGQGAHTGVAPTGGTVADGTQVDSRPPAMTRPVPLWEHGHANGTVDAATAEEHAHVVMDLGEEWTPYLFTERANDTEPVLPNAYRPTYLALARGEFPDDRHGDRAREDEYLELFGIAPTLGVLRQRMRQTHELACAQNLDLAPLQAFDGTLGYHGSDEGRADARRFDALERKLTRLAQHAGKESPDALVPSDLHEHDRDDLAVYQRIAPRVHAVRAAQDRLECEGFFHDLRGHIRGAFDWQTHEALAKFEKRHRVYGWGYLSAGTLEEMRRSPMESDREDVIRVLTERAMHAYGAIEDGSTSTRADGTERTFRGRDGQEHPIPNLEHELRDAVIDAFGLQTPESTLAFLEGLGDLPADQARYVAFQGPRLPEYYAPDMELSVEIDRGDVWYDFPYDDQGHERSQPVDHRPHLTIFAEYNGAKIPLARFGTTIGGWRTEHIDDLDWWKYKESPPGPVVWTEIVAAPVWLPPESTPPRDLLVRNRHRHAGDPPYEIKVDEIGPSYASAYGLVAAYHHPFRELDDGTRVYDDEGIRTHGSVDYTSIMRRHSHGCHRLYNHIAVRLMSFVLAHRRHQRVGQQHVHLERDMDYENETYTLDIEEGGYVFALERPVPVNVTEGRIRGQVQQPIEIPIPKYNEAVGAYVMPDGGAVLVRGNQLVPTQLPPPPAGAVYAMDAGVMTLVTPTGAPYVAPDGGVAVPTTTAVPPSTATPGAGTPSAAMDAGVWGTTPATGR